MGSSQNDEAPRRAPRRQFHEPPSNPHDLRHRYASVKIAEGVPVTQLAAQLGHAKKSLTLDVYSHVLSGE